MISRNLGSFVGHGVRVVRRLFPDEASDFADGAAEQWENMMNVPFLPDSCDLGCKMTQIAATSASHHRFSSEGVGIYGLHESTLYADRKDREPPPQPRGRQSPHQHG